jgi:hypothetical protein
MTKNISTVLVASLILATTACKSGGGAEVRTDIIAAMARTKQPLDACYENALARNRKLKGMVTVELIAEASTGQFKNVLIRRDEVADPQVRMCIITEVSKQKLAKPTSSNTQIPYAFRFAPLN